MGKYLVNEVYTLPVASTLGIMRTSTPPLKQDEAENMAAAQRNWAISSIEPNAKEKLEGEGKGGKMRDIRG